MKLLPILLSATCLVVSACGAPNPPLPSGNRISVQDFAEKRAQAKIERVVKAQYESVSKTKAIQISDSDSDRPETNIQFESEKTENE